VKRIERGNVIVESGRIEGVIPRDQLIPKEMLRVGDRIRAFVTKIDRTAKGPQLILSRIAPEFLMRLFELEVPEIEEGLIEIRPPRATRHPRQDRGEVERSRLDPQGTCIGMRGSRVTAVTNELAGERVDIILFSEDPGRSSSSTRSRRPRSRRSSVDERSTAWTSSSTRRISRSRSAAWPERAPRLRAHRWELNLMSVEDSQKKHDEEGTRLRQLFMDKIDVDEEVADILIGEGFTSLEEIAYVPLNEMLEIEAFDADTVNELRSRARNALLTDAIVREEERRERRGGAAQPRGMDTEIASALAVHGITTRDALAISRATSWSSSRNCGRPRAGIDHEGARALVRRRAGRGRRGSGCGAQALEHCATGTRGKRGTHMAHTTIEQFATELKLPPGALIEQLAKAGVSGKAEGDGLSEQDKTKLLEYLQKQHGAAGEPKKKITLTRKQTTEIKAAGTTGKGRTIQVEVRKKRVFVKRDESRRRRPWRSRRRRLSPPPSSAPRSLPRAKPRRRRRRSSSPASRKRCRRSRSRWSSARRRRSAKPRKPPPRLRRMVLLPRPPKRRRRRRPLRRPAKRPPPKTPTEGTLHRPRPSRASARNRSRRAERVPGRGGAATRAQAARRRHRRHGCSGLAPAEGRLGGVTTRRLAKAPRRAQPRRSSATSRSRRRLPSRSSRGSSR
jgi:transcription termination factor NusA